MSMQSGFGAASACDEILKVIEDGLINGLTYLEIVREVRQTALDIKKAGEDGWY